jgi:hypothetical protein
MPDGRSSIERYLRPERSHSNNIVITASLTITAITSTNHYTTQTPTSTRIQRPPTVRSSSHLTMKASQILALSATLIFQAQACARVRIDRYAHDGYGTIQDMQIYDNDNAAKVLPFPINFDARDDENLLQVDGYFVKLKYKDGKHHPYGGRIIYPEGCESFAKSSVSEIHGNAR